MFASAIEVMLTVGNVHDVTVADKLLSGIDLKGTAVLADKDYGKWVLREFIADHDADFASRPGIVKLIHGMSNGDSTDSSLIVSFTLDSCSTRVYCSLTALR